MSSPREQLSKALEPLVDQPLAQRLLSEASALRDRSLRAQEATLGALNLPTAADLARLERRLRALADAIGRLGDQVDRLEVRLRRSGEGATHAALEELRAEIAGLRAELGERKS